MHSGLFDTLLALQAFQVLFLALHDWIPLGRLNDVRAVRAENALAKLFVTTLISTAPFAVGLVATIYCAGAPPHWLMTWLWVSYGILFVGELQAWWIPYLVVPQPARAARYEKMFGRTLAFLPARNGIRPNALHAILHVSTLATLFVLAMLSF